ncbi:small s protein-like protein [Apiospora kogelbergensis]|uniref:small s protein-like protein n=1 Tax=Apiospora kogelbergensis TaxID=1337665 RepID=UPI00312FEB92
MTKSITSAPPFPPLPRRLRVFKSTLRNRQRPPDTAGPEASIPTASGSPQHVPWFNEGVLQHFILESLRFKSMDFRAQDIEEAHGTSFDWIFNHQASDSHPNFSEWLATTKHGFIYWITGKPGSGKSTLTRYISGHPETTRLLRAWAFNKHIMTAGFYFWTSGSQEQRSQTGLLRSLLFQLLSAKPYLIAQCLPNLCEKLAPMTSKERVSTTIEWSLSELMDGFSIFLSNGLTHTKLCLFVDGLDELEGDHEAIISFFRGMTEGKSADRIKLCLSSRPWPVFERAFEWVVPNLKLQDSNFEDMFRYTIDKLNSKDTIHFAMVDDRDKARYLIQTLVEMGNGVFLWVRLVVEDLIRRFADGGRVRIVDMLDYVVDLPTELDSLFELLVFGGQTEHDTAETSRLFQLVRAREIVADFVQDESATSLSLVELAFACSFETNRHGLYAINGRQIDLAALSLGVEQESEQKAMQRCADTRSWTLIHSLGLLQVHHQSGRVTYIHRTLRDWLLLSPGNEVWDRLEEAGWINSVDGPPGKDGTDCWDPHRCLLRSYILQMKHPVHEPEQHRRLDEWYPGIVLALTHARHMKYDTQKLHLRLIGELERTISCHWLWRDYAPTDHWAINSFGTYEQRHGNKLVFHNAYLALCTRFGLGQYSPESTYRRALDAEAEEIEDAYHLALGGWGEPLESAYSRVFVAAETSIQRANQRKRAAEAAKDITEETPLLHRALEFLCSRQKTIYPLSSLSFVRQLLDRSQKYAANPQLSRLIGGVNAPSWSSPLLAKKDVTTWIMVLRHLRDAKRRGWIQRSDVDPEGSERWTAIVLSLIEDGGADLDAVVPGDGWDPETSAKGVLGRGGMLDELGNVWVEKRLVPCFGDAEGATPAAGTSAAGTAEQSERKQSRLEHIFRSSTE